MSHWRVIKLIINHKTRNDEAPNGPQKYNASIATSARQKGQINGRAVA
jgi:hypothetical protein